jgi:uncharacterized membrane protein YqhA
MPRSNLGPVARFLFFSRWLQLPLYLGLIVAQAAYVGHFAGELLHRIAQTGIRLTFLLSALAVAAVDRIMPQGRAQAARVAAGAGNDHGAH